jgi:hypothetical protein
LPTKSRPKTSAKQAAGSSVALVTGILEGYAAKAVFRGFSAIPWKKGQALYRMIWHHDRPFELLLDVPNKTLRFAEVLPGVPADSTMYRELRAFLRSRQSPDLPEHRRVNPARARIRASNRGGRVSLAMTVNDGDFDYATRKMIQVVHEIFLVFLVDGPYFEYLVEKLGLDPDRY